METKYELKITNKDIDDDNVIHETVNIIRPCDKSQVLKFFDEYFGLYREDGEIVPPDLEKIDENLSKYTDDVEFIKNEFDSLSKAYDIYTAVKNSLENGGSPVEWSGEYYSSGLTVEIEEI